MTELTLEQRHATAAKCGEGILILRWIPPDGRNPEQLVIAAKPSERRHVRNAVTEVIQKRLKGGAS